MIRDARPIGRALDHEGGGYCAAVRSFAFPDTGASRAQETTTREPGARSRKCVFRCSPSKRVEVVDQLLVEARALAAGRMQYAGALMVMRLVGEAAVRQDEMRDLVRERELLGLRPAGCRFSGRVKICQPRARSSSPDQESVISAQ
jgi:hypothetical protein